MVLINRNIPLKNLSTMQTGGAADFFAACKNEQDIIEALEFANNHNLTVSILGGGSNSLIADDGVRGLVIKIAIEGVTVSEAGLAVAGAGVSWDSFVTSMCNQSMSGIEALSGIPGLVGATPIQNVGAYGQDVSETIKSVRAIHRQTLKSRTFQNKDCRFSYRNSRFKSEEPDEWIVTEVRFQLDPHATPHPRYEELKLSLDRDPHWSQSSRDKKILMLRDHVLKIRSSKGMVLDPYDPDSVSLGSFFTNPIVNQSIRESIEKNAQNLRLGSGPKFHASGDNMWKVSAAWLIENSGINKGFKLGTAKVSSKHVLAITNPGQALTSDILKLQKYIEDSVFNAFGVRLQREPVLLGSED